MRAKQMSTNVLFREQVSAQEVVEPVNDSACFLLMATTGSPTLKEERQMKRIALFALVIAASTAAHATPNESGRQLQAPYPTWLTTHQG
ncbi:hypothetical protein [Stutzerimonas azotifigens]|uniref:Uncharacterized protein n=1 Tax=Stutzerimonas azotifigens TaxID=291995 RepID=A0ABR5YX18_9GAMM|nr:hypothetical protein [Stutzerimonas azotifigens]MBA1272476.1 hypothetical protein [Stutzerimonas azotifigens]